MLDIHIYENIDEFLQKHRNDNLILATTKAVNTILKSNIYPVPIFFRERNKRSAEELLKAHADNCIKIPMLKNKKARSLNLSNSVAIIIYEALRQNNFPNMF